MKHITGGKCFCGKKLPNAKKNEVPFEFCSKECKESKRQVKPYTLKDLGNQTGDEGRTDSRLAIITPNGKVLILFDLSRLEDAKKLVRHLNKIGKVK